MNSLLIAVSRGLFAAYVVISLAAFFPAQPFDPNWQLRVISNLANNAALPLVGLVLLNFTQGAQDPVSPQSQRIGQRIFQFRLAAIGVAVGFFLLALVQLRVSYVFIQQSDALHLSQNQQLQQQFVNLKNALDASNEQLQLTRAATLLLPPDKRPALNSLPIPRQKAILLQQLTSNDQRARRDLDRQRGQRQAALVVDGLRNLLLCLVFAATFFAFRPRIDLRAWLNAPED